MLYIYISKLPRSHRESLTATARGDAAAAAEAQPPLRLGRLRRRGLPFPLRVALRVALRRRRGQRLLCTIIYIYVLICRHFSRVDHALLDRRGEPAAMQGTPGE